MVHILWKIHKYRVCAEIRTVPDAICLHVLHDSESPESIWVGSEQTVQWKSETLDGSMSATIFLSEIEDCFVLLCKVKAHCINILTANMSIIMYLISKRVKHGNICWIFQTEDSQSD